MNGIPSPLVSMPSFQPAGGFNPANMGLIRSQYTLPTAQQAVALQAQTEAARARVQLQHNSLSAYNATAHLVSVPAMLSVPLGLRLPRDQIALY